MTDTAADIDTEPAVQAALTQLGVPYVWGGETPGQGFDCSGLVQWSFKQAGIDLPRTTFVQVTAGVAVDGPPQRGDLVFPSADHVVIALGGNQCIQAPDVGDVVKESTYWTTPYAVRRVGTNSGGIDSIDALPDYSAPNAATVGFGDFFTGGKPVKSAVTFFSFLMSQHGWYRMIRIMLGVLLVVIGTYYLAKESTTWLN